MRPLLVSLIGLALSTAAMAFDGQKAAEDYYEVRPACRIGEMKGVPISAEESARQCEVLAELGKELRDNGFCWYAPEQIWKPCKG